MSDYEQMKDYPVIEPDNIESHEVKENWKLKTLFKKDARGKTILWVVGFDGNNLLSAHGCVDGKIRVDKKIINTNNSGRSLIQQAIFEANSLYKKKYTKDCYRPENDSNPIFNPMLANEYKEGMINEWPIGVEPKIDGIRAISKYRGEEIKIFSRSNNEFPYLEEIKEDLKILYKYLEDKSIQLDGELYTMEFGFDRLRSAVKTEKNKHPDNDRIMYCLFDIITNETFDIRREKLEIAYNLCIKNGFNIPRIFILKYYKVNSHQELIDYHKCFVQAGYEGTMIRILPGKDPKSIEHSKYKNSRSKGLLKFKDFFEDEGIITEVGMASGTEEGAAILTVKSKNDKIFTLRMEGSFERRIFWAQNPHLIIGKEVTYKYQEITKDGFPRFPVGKSIRDYE